MKIHAPLILILALVLVACGKSESPPPAPPPAPAAAPAGQAGAPSPTAVQGAVVSGTVKLRGPVSPPRRVPVNKDPEVCGKEALAQDLFVSRDGGVQWAVVTVEGTKARPAGKAVLDQKDCHYQPHVLVVAPSQPIDILNSDGILHNVHTYSVRNPTINYAQPKFKKVIQTQFDRPELIQVRCDVHGWMNGWLLVTEARAATTDAEGNFTIPDVPPGTYTVKLWHETLGEQSRTVTVGTGGAVLNFELSKK